MNWPKHIHPLEKNDKALKYYEQLLTDYPNSPFVIDAQIGIANSYFKKWEYVKSETAYLKILSEHESDSEICEIAAKGYLIYTQLKINRARQRMLLNGTHVLIIQKTRKKICFMVPLYRLIWTQIITKPFTSSMFTWKIFKNQESTLETLITI